MQSDQITAETLKLPIEGIGLKHATLGEELGEERVLLVFLRHLG